MTLLLSVILALAMVDTATASPTKVSVNPPSIWDPAMVPSTQFSVDITVDQVTRLQSYQFLMFFNPDVLHGVNVENGPFLGSAGATPIVYPGIGFDNEKGWLYLFIAALDVGLPPPMYPTGGGVLATVTFEVVGIGTSPLTFGIQTGLLNMTGGYEFDEEWCYGLYPVPQYPGGPIDWVEDHPLAQEWQDSLGHGWFCNGPGPELYIRRGGSGGGAGAWPEWSVGTLGEEQVLYSHVTNKGSMGAEVKVRYIVVSTYATEEHWTDVYAVGVGDPDETRITVSTDSFIPGEGVHSGYYHVYAELWFRVGGMTEFVPYSTLQEVFGGFGDTKPQGTPVKFKVS